MVDEILAGDTGFFAYHTEHRSRVSIRHILAVGIDFDYRPSAHNRMVGRVILLSIVRMEGMCIVGRHHERSVDAAQILLLAAAETADYAAEQLLEHRRSCSLLGARTGLLVVENSHDAGLCRRGGFKQCGHSAVNHAEVVETARGQEFLVKTHKAGGSGVEEREVEVNYVLHATAESIGHSAEQQIVLLGRILDDGYDRKHILLLRERIALVDGAVEMDSQMWYW